MEEHRLTDRFAGTHERVFFDRLKRVFTLVSDGHLVIFRHASMVFMTQRKWQFLVGSECPCVFAMITRTCIGHVALTFPRVREVMTCKCVFH